MAPLAYPVQLHVPYRVNQHAPFTEAAFTPVRNEYPSHVKPTGGLWTSTWDAAKRTSGWVEWCLEESCEEWVEEEYWYLCTPAATARIATIDSLDDLCSLLFLYPRIPPQDTLSSVKQISLYKREQRLDFEGLAEDYDAIHLTERGQWATRLTTPNLYGWDCESTLWLHWCFTAIQKIPSPLQEREHA